MTEGREPFEPPGESVGDRAGLLARAVISAFPVVGGPALELYNAAVRTPLERRTAAWMEEVAEALRKLRTDLNALAERVEFVSAMVQAGRIAVGTHNPEKLAALKNAVVKVAVEPDLDDEETTYFFALIDQLSPSSMRLLMFLCDPTGWARARGITFPSWHTGDKAHALEFALPEFSGRRETYDRLTRDLFDRGLLTINSLHTTVTGSEIMEGCGTPMGNRFIRFISEA